MDRVLALDLISEKVKNKNLIKHMLAVEALMKDLADIFCQDQELWALAGLIHDLDVEIAKNNNGLHGKITAGILKERGSPDEVINAVLAHVGHKSCDTMMEKAIFAADPLTGFIVACALMVKAPDGKKLDSLTVDFCLRRFKEKRFAAGADREQIKTCERLGIKLEKFLEIGIKAMQKIKESLQI